MDGSSFDDMIRTATARGSRRDALRAIAGGLLATLVPTANAGKAKRGKKKGKRGKPCSERCSGRCVARCPDVMTRNQSTCQCECPAGMIKCGNVCVGEDRCCPGEKTCGGGCIREQDCCPHTHRECPGGACVPHGTCCPVIEEECGDACCDLGELCCHGECLFQGTAICTKDGWCPSTEGQACCAGSIEDCDDDPCCRFSEGEACCVSNLDPLETTCCPGGHERCAPGGCCPVGMTWKSDGNCDACCPDGVIGCNGCVAPVAGRG